MPNQYGKRSTSRFGYGPGAATAFYNRGPARGRGSESFCIQTAAPPLSEPTRQTVSNPGLRNRPAALAFGSTRPRYPPPAPAAPPASEAAALRAQVETLTARVAALEAELCKAKAPSSAPPTAPPPAPAPRTFGNVPLGQQQAKSYEEQRWDEYAKGAAAPAPAAEGVVGLASVPELPDPRPATAPYRTVQLETASQLSWSADAFGRSKTPGWWHVHRREVLARRARLAEYEREMADCHISHRGYADEAVRIAYTGRLAF